MGLAFGLPRVCYCRGDFPGGDAQGRAGGIFLSPRDPPTANCAPPFLFRCWLLGSTHSLTHSFTYSAVISACEKGKHPEPALVVFQAMQWHGPPFPPRPRLPGILAGRAMLEARSDITSPAFLRFAFLGLTFPFPWPPRPHFASLPGLPGLHLASQNRPQDLPKTVPGSVLTAMPKS